jgi:2,5-diketo-D-gluconate reductase A
VEQGIFVMNTTYTLANGVKMPIIALGSYQLVNIPNAIKCAYDLGIRFIDTAELYGNEREIGSVMQKDNLNDIFIQSKLWQSHMSYSGALNAFDTSWKNLTNKTRPLDS